MINRKEALTLIKKYIRENDNIKLSFATEAVLKEIAKSLNKDENLWGLSGLLHNLDYEFTDNRPEQRGTLSAQLLEDLLPNNAINAIKANNYLHTDYMPVSSLDKSLIAGVAVIDFILDTSKTLPKKKISELNFETLKNKYQDESFSSNNIRSKIKLCKDIGIEINQFLELSLNALKGISNKLNI